MRPRFKLILLCAGLGLATNVVVAWGCSALASHWQGLARSDWISEPYDKWPANWDENSVSLVLCVAGAISGSGAVLVELRRAAVLDGRHGEGCRVGRPSRAVVVFHPGWRRAGQSTTRQSVHPDDGLASGVAAGDVAGATDSGDAASIPREVSVSGGDAAISGQHVADLDGNQHVAQRASVPADSRVVGNGGEYWGVCDYMGGRADGNTRVEDAAAGAPGAMRAMRV